MTMLRGLRSAQLRVADIEAAKDWYARLLDTEPYFDEPFYIGFDVAGYEFGLLPGQPSVDGALFLWATEDPGAFVDYAEQLGATRAMGPDDTGDGIVVATFHDPFGNEFGVIRNPHFAAEVVAARAGDLSGSSISITVDVPVEPLEAWRLWATEEGLARWWTEHTKIDLRPGGHYEIHFNPDAPPGDKGGDWCRVLSFSPGRMLSFTWNAPDHLATRPLHTWVVIEFAGSATGTRLEFEHLGWPQSGLNDPSSDWPATYEYFEEAWEYVFRLFVEQFAPDA